MRMRMTVRVDLELGEIIILQNLITHTINGIEKDTIDVKLKDGITPEQFSKLLVSVATKLFTAGRSIGDEMV